jgi:hypothetical protein
MTRFLFASPAAGLSLSRPASVDGQHIADFTIFYAHFLKIRNALDSTLNL